LIYEKNLKKRENSNSQSKIKKKPPRLVNETASFLVAGTLKISNLLPDYYHIIFTHDFLFEELIKTSNE
jgi:hypothetical protein